MLGSLSWLVLIGQVISASLPPMLGPIMYELDVSAAQASQLASWAVQALGFGVSRSGFVPFAPDLAHTPYSEHMGCSRSRQLWGQIHDNLRARNFYGRLLMASCFRKLQFSASSSHYWRLGRRCRRVHGPNDCRDAVSAPVYCRSLFYVNHFVAWYFVLERVPSSLESGGRWVMTRSSACRWRESSLVNCVIYNVLFCGAKDNSTWKRQVDRGICFNTSPKWKRCVTIGIILLVTSRLAVLHFQLPASSYFPAASVYSQYAHEDRSRLSVQVRLQITYAIDTYRYLLS